MPAPSNQTCGTADVIASLPFTPAPFDLSSSWVNITHTGSCWITNGAKQMWWTWTADFDGYIFVSVAINGTTTGGPRLALYSGSCGALVELDCDVHTNHTGGANAYCQIAVTNGTQYFFQSGENVNALTAHDLTLIVDDIPPQDNVSCASATVVPLLPFRLEQDVTFAVNDPANPCPSCMANPCGQDWNATWFQWTAPFSGPVGFSTWGSFESDGTLDADTNLSVWTGSCGALVELECSEDDVGFLSRVNFTAVAGTTYYFLVSWFNRPFFLERRTVLSGVAHVVCDQALSITTVPGLVQVDVAGADNGGDECPSCAFDCGNRFMQTWYRLIAPADGTVKISTVNSPMTDTLVSVWTGTCGALVEIACGEDDVLSWAEVTVAVTAGTTYWIKVSSYNPAEDDDSILLLTLSWTSDPPDGPPIAGDPFADGDLIAGNVRAHVYNGTTGVFKRYLQRVGIFPDIGGQSPVDHKLYLPYEVPGHIAIYAADASNDGSFDALAGGGHTPHTASFNQANQLFVGYVGEGGIACGETPIIEPIPPDTYAIRRFTTAGVEEAVFNVAGENGGAQHIDLSADQQTMLYTSLGRRVLAYDVVNDLQLPDFATLPSDGGVARGIRILPDGTVLIADKIEVKRLAADGSSIVQTYNTTPPGIDWGTLSLTPDGTQFYVANRADGAVETPRIVKFDVDTGDVVLEITDDVPDTGGGMCSGGITVWNGFRAGVGEPPPNPDSPCVGDPDDSMEGIGPPGEDPAHRMALSPGSDSAGGSGHPLSEAA